MVMIELTPAVTTNPNSTVLINTDHIIAITPGVADKNQSEIDCGDDACYHVKESVQDIINTLGIQVIKVDSKRRPIYKDKRKPFRKPFKKHDPYAHCHTEGPVTSEMTEEVLNS